MSKHLAILSLAAAVMGAAALPTFAAAADLYGYGGDDRPLAFHSRDDVYLDEGRARAVHRDDLGPARVERRGPGPVVFDERGGQPGFEGERRPSFVPRPAYGYGDAVDLGPRPYRAEAGYGGGFRPAPFYRPVAIPVGPAFGEGYGVPEGGCTVEQARSVTPAGWQKVVTHRTCYRR